MLLFLDILFNFFFFIFRLYYHVDKFFILSSSGTKLKKYIEKKDLQGITSSLETPNLKNFYSKINFLSRAYKVPKNEYKYYINLILVSMTSIAIKLALTYNFLVSNFFYIEIFQKQVLISSILSDKFIYFKVFYYVTSFYFIIFASSKILKFLKKYFTIKENKQKRSTHNFLSVGIDETKTDVNISKSGAFQNIMITGSIGSGKTSSAVTNILAGLVSNNIGGLIIDVKGNYISIVRKVLRKYGIEDKLIEISLNSDTRYNPLNQNIPEIEIANMVKKVLELLSKSNNSDPFWLDKVEEYIKDFIIIAKAANGYVTFYDIHNMTIDSDYLESIIKKLKKQILANKFSDSKLFSINLALQTIKSEYSKLDDRTLGIIKSEITRVTSAFVTDYEIFTKFSNNSSPIDFDSNKIIVFSMDFGSHRKMAKILSTYLKLDFQRQIVSNHSNKEIFFICDEYQEFANEEDAHFFSISREYKCINVVSMQSYSSLMNTIGNDKSGNVIIQNFVNKIFFRNDDSMTNNEVIKLLGKEVKENKTVSFSEGGGNLKYNAISKKFRSYKSSLTQSYTLSEKHDYLIDESYLTRKLKTFEALCFISDGNEIKVYSKVKMKRWEELYEEK